MGLGWHLNRLRGYTAINKSGATFGTTTDAVFIPDLKLGMALFINTVANAPAMTRKGLEILAPIVEQLEATPRAPASETDGDLEALAGRYVWKEMRIAVEIKIVEDALVADITGGLEPERARLVTAGDGTFRVHGGSANEEIVSFQAGESGFVEHLRLGPYWFKRESKVSMETSAGS
jgi:hypothetical protein